MYKEYFGLSELPFSIAPDPRYLYMSEQHREALGHLVYGVTTDGGFVLLTGEVGTGKTTVCRCLLEQAPADTDIAFILNPRVTVEELLATICDELGIAYPEAGATNKILIDRINAYLLDSYGRGRRTVLIIEEAQNLGPDLLEQVRLLTNLETNERKLLQIIMLGQPELRDLLARSELRQLAQRITARYHLGPLSKKEVPAYVRHRLSVAGGREGLFPPATLSRLWRLSSGIPRLVNLICDRALLGAYVQGKERVDRSTLSTAAREVFGDLPARANRHSLGWMAGGLAVITMVAAVAAGYYSQVSRRPQVVAQPAPVRQTVVKAPATELPVRPEGVTAEASQREAFKTLFEQWGLVFGNSGKEAACSRIVRQGMRCLDALGSLDAIRKLNRPVVLRLLDESGGQYYAVLTGLGDGTASLRLGARTLQVSVKEMERRWLGDYTIIWKAPPDFAREIRPGDRGRHVKWLSSRLASINGGDAPAGDSILYDQSLVRQIRQFQLSEGLVPDGIVGPHTIIRLDGVADGRGPVLANRKGSS